MDDKKYCHECEKELNNFEIEHNDGYCEDCLLQIKLDVHKDSILMYD